MRAIDQNGHMLHQSVLLEASVDALNVTSVAHGVFVDATFGRGGTSLAILARLDTAGCLFAFDCDTEAVKAGSEIQDPRFRIIHSSFSALKQQLAGYGVQSVHGIVFDLGVSSPQLDTPIRGFSFRYDGPLDMRMNQTEGQTVAELLATVDERELIRILQEYGEERFAKRIARAIIRQREQKGCITSTLELATLVAQAIPYREKGQHPATRTFQALRIAVNQELTALACALEQAVELLAPCGRLAVISFHSLEDRLVKQYFRVKSDANTLPNMVPVRANELPRPVLRLVSKAVRPSTAEVVANIRSRSAILRVAEKVAYHET